jgi:hypothetical protein
MQGRYKFSVVGMAVGDEGVIAGVRVTIAGLDDVRKGGPMLASLTMPPMTIYGEASSL